jgi:hypothetical protein
MAVSPELILEQLRAVDAERQRWAASPELRAKVVALKAFQHQRFSNTYRDLLASPRYAAVARFFLDELYGPKDFSERDAQFARVVPALVRVFPKDVVETVMTLAELHALSEGLDTAVASALNAAKITAADYVQAWQRVGHAALRSKQIDLTLQVAASLDHLTGKPLVRSSLRLMRGPARLAGLSQLQQFLEAGFDTFRALRGAEEFITTVGVRERALASALFAASFSGERFDRSLSVGLMDLPDCSEKIRDDARLAEEARK